MNIDNQDRLYHPSPVILSAAKDLCVAQEILRCAQDDRAGPGQ